MAIINCPHCGKDIRTVLRVKSTKFDRTACYRMVSAYVEGDTLSSICRKYGVSTTTLNKIMDGEYYPRGEVKVFTFMVNDRKKVIAL